MPDDSEPYTNRQIELLRRIELAVELREPDPSEVKEAMAAVAELRDYVECINQVEEHDQGDDFGPDIGDPLPDLQPDRDLGWTSQATLGRGVRRGGVTAIFVVLPFAPFPVAMVETGVKDATMAEFFGSHAHAVIAEECPSLSVAIQLAERAAEEWEPGVAPTCTCEDIAKPRGESTGERDRRLIEEKLKAPPAGAPAES